MNYRPEIDGLRAVAVLSVILFHAGLNAFRGGFVGVDVFFVISGYLITSIILKDLEAGTFSFWDFYERRARRILPMLFFVIFCSIPFAWMWMMPKELKAFSLSVIAVVGFVSNILFWKQSGYFDTANELKPLLHTWSLAVEEQFYIFFPILMLIIWRFSRKKIVLAIASVALASLVLSEYYSRANPLFNFYWLPTRAWELAAGSLCAIVTIKPRKMRDDVLSGIGLLAILFSIFIYDKYLPFPSLYALVPVLGACAIILFAQRGTLVSSLLSWKPLVGLGMISYGAYLWHQPIFAFARIRSLTDPSHFVMAALAIASIILAMITWRYIEQPARRRHALPFPNKKAVFASAGVFAIALFAFGAGGQFSKGYPNRISPELISLQHRIANNYGLSEDCWGELKLPPSCITSDQPEVIVWGDSFAIHLVKGFIASNNSIGIVQYTRSGCGPFLDLAPASSNYARSWSSDCILFNDSVLNFIKNTPSIKYAVLGSIFGQYLEHDSLVLTREGSVVFGRDAATDAFLKTLAALKEIGVKPVIFAPPPSPGFDGGKCNVNAIRFGGTEEDCRFSRREAELRQAEVRHFLREIDRNFDVVWLDDAICNGDACFASQNGTFIYWDGGHLSKEGSSYLGKKMNFYRLLSVE